MLLQFKINFKVNLGETNKTRAMVELSKKILMKVSFDPKLFQKELFKALTWINDKEEIKKLREWCHVEFGRKYPLILQKAFV